MGKGSKSFSLFLIGILAVSCLMVVGITSGQSVPKPSAPEFTLKVDASSIEVTIKNQPITIYQVNGSDPNLYYGFRFKDNASRSNWIIEPLYFVGISSYEPYYKASDLDYTNVTLSIDDYQGYRLPVFSTGGQLDFQVLALVGNEIPFKFNNQTIYGFDGVTSVWSSTQTITIPHSSNSTPTDTSSTGNSITSLLTSFALVAVAVSVAVVISLLMYVRHLKRSTIKPDDSTV